MDDAAAWRAAGALITHKMLGELSYEHMLEPVAHGDAYRLERSNTRRFVRWLLSRFGEPIALPTDAQDFALDAVDNP